MYIAALHPSTTKDSDGELVVERVRDLKFFSMIVLIDMVSSTDIDSLEPRSTAMP
jgi:hypothetical protein